MQLSRPIGLSLSEPLVERIDAIARTEGISRSSVARTFLVIWLAEYESKIGLSEPFDTEQAALSRRWRPRIRDKAESEQG